jgi:hypothetical protein
MGYFPEETATEGMVCKKFDTDWMIDIQNLMAESTEIHLQNIKKNANLEAMVIGAQGCTT